MNEKAEKGGKCIFFGERQEAFYFWLVGLGIVIPTITYGSAILINFLLATFFCLIGISAAYYEPIALGIYAGCVAVSLFGYYKLWVLYKGKRGKNKGIT